MGVPVKRRQLKSFTAHDGERVHCIFLDEIEARTYSNKYAVPIYSSVTYLGPFFYKPLTDADPLTDSRRKGRTKRAVKKRRTRKC